MRSVSASVIVAIVLSGCESAPPPAPIVVYAIGDDQEALEARLAEFTDDTEIAVTLMFSKSSKNADLVIDNSGSPPADVLITNNVADIWRAGDEGALRKIRTESIRSVAKNLRDPDDLWVAFDIRYVTINVAADQTDAVVGSYADLARPEYAGQLCLSSSRLAVNRSLIAMLIDDVGVKSAERFVRGWMRNLARPSFDTESELRSAIKSGSCPYAISSTTLRSENGYIDIDGVGVARHARNPASANALIDWLLRDESLRDFTASNGKNIGVAGWRDEEARLLAERAGYR